MAKGSVGGKDPGVSWVFNDWQGGTMTLTRFQKGCYMDLLTAQFNTGHLSLDEIKTVLGSDFGSAWPTLQKKFKIDTNGLLYNERLEFEIIKRKSFNQTRRDNAKKKENLDDHMGNGIGNEIVIDNIDLIKKYGQEMISDFLRYWNEPNKKGKRKWELQDTWSLDGRLVTWSRNDKKFNYEVKKENKTQSVINEVQEAINIVNRNR